LPAASDAQCRTIARVLHSELRDQGSAVTVVIPSRNRWQLLRTALASALAQRDVDVEVVVVDDGSTDRTPAELRKLRDERVRVVRRERREGVSVARNVGLDHARAPWVAFLDDDDVWAPGHLAAMLGALRDSGLEWERVGLVFSGHLDLDADRHVTEVSPAAPADSVHDGLKRMNVVGCPSRVVLRTDAVRAVGGFDAQLSILADWDLWVRVLAGNEVVRCPELLVGYMHHAGNMHLDGERFLAELGTLREKHGWSRREPRDAVFGDLLPSYLAATYRKSGRRFRAALWYARAFRARHDPRDLGRIAGVLLGERLIELSRLGRRTIVDPSLGRWLEDVRRAERAPTTGPAPPPGLYGDTAAT
jgi:glycosyltransferase involved in cell wall biosynthesis